MITEQAWQNLSSNEINKIVSQQASTAVIYLNGTRRWFMSQSNNWNEYASLTGQAQRNISQLFYDHGFKTLLQPLLGYDLLDRGPEYLHMAVAMGLRELSTASYTNWFHQQEIRVSFYGKWEAVLAENGFSEVVEGLKRLADETAKYSAHQLLFGLFADGDLSNIVSLAQGLKSGAELIEQFYGQPVQPINLILGAGQPVIWDIPLLDTNKAALYFMQAPTFCLNQPALRKILYDYLYQRLNDDQLFEDLADTTWQDFDILGIGKQTERGWIAL